MSEGTGEAHGPVDQLLLPYLERLRASIPGEPLRLLDVHTHVGSNDPDGFSQTPAELIAGLEAIDARGVAFPMHEPAGYPPANDAVIAAARESGGRFSAFCRVDPAAADTDPVVEAERCLDAGAAGIKLHPRAEGFTLSEPGVERLFGLAAERRVPILVHAGRGIPALGRDAVSLADAHPDARLILAHGGISDLAWLQALVEPGSNLFFDTSWWNPADLIALFACIPSSQVLWASDSPYTTPLAALVWHGRCAIQAGVEPDAFRAIAGEQAERVLSGADTVRLGRPAGESGALDPMLERVYTHLVSSFGATNAGGDPAEKLDLARLSCQVPEEYPEAELLHELEALIGGVIAAHLPVVSDGEHRFGAVEQAIVSLLIIARTPAAGAAGA